MMFLDLRLRSTNRKKCVPRPDIQHIWWYGERLRGFQQKTGPTGISSIAKANKTIAWVSRNIICKDKSVMLLIYKSLIRPHLEYAVQCWAPSPRFGNWGIILELEKVQRKFTRLINDIGTLTYGERLKSLTLTTLAERRMRGDLIEKHSCNLLFVLFIQAKTPNRAVENGVFHYPVGPFVFRVTAAFAISLI